jgi:siroheme synthase-like protein
VSGSAPSGHTPWLPIHLNLQDRRVLLVGAGPVARRRLRALVEAGAVVRQVAPDLHFTDAQSLPAATEGSLGPCEAAERLARPYLPGDLDDCQLVLACATPEVNAAVAADARIRGVWVARADEALGGDVEVPARWRLGSLVLSLGTSGQAPAASAVLVARLEQHIPAAWGAFVAGLSEARARMAPGLLRMNRLRALARGPFLAYLEAGDEARARAELDRAIEGDEATS